MADTAESAGALGTLFFYVLFVHPVCAWILAPKRFRKDRAIIYAILFLATIAIGKMVRRGGGAESERGRLASARRFLLEFNLYADIVGGNHWCVVERRGILRLICMSCFLRL